MRPTGSPNRLAFLPSPSYSVLDAAAVLLTAAVVAVWAEAAGGQFSLLALLGSTGVFLAYYLVGSLLAGWRALAAGVLFDLPLRLLAGYAVFNTALFAMAWLSPLGIVADFAILLVLAAVAFAMARPVRERRPDEAVGLIVIGVTLAAATLWCQDSLRPTSAQGHVVAFKPWIDGFYHAVHIRIFGASHGASSIEDFRMAGMPARLYHYGDYLTPAFIKQLSGIHSYTAFAGILAPMGVFFTGLGAYVIVASFWGAWPGLAACAAMLLLPDGVEQGMRDTFMSYHWLTQISPSANYGLALLAVAWLFVLRGCSQGSRLQVVAGWLVGGIVIAYKAHFFIASTLLLLLVPALFFRAGLGLRKRAAWAASAIAFYVVALRGVQKVPGVPPIRFDGSCVGKILDLVKSFMPRGGLRDFLDGHIGRDHSLLANLSIGGSFVLLAALGILAPLLGLLVLRLRRRSPLLFVLFPLLLVANFLAMFFGLAMDFRSSTPDELSHRPVVVMYFFVTAWLGGAAGLWLLEARRLGRFARPAIVGLACVLMTVPAFFGSGVQGMWAMRMFSPVQVPIGLVQAAQYMREHGSARDLFQESRFDRTCTVAALAERRPYAARNLTIMRYHADLLNERIDAVENLMRLDNADAVAATARSLGLTWFLLDPSDKVEWPAALVDQPAFALDGFRLYRF